MTKYNSLWAWMAAVALLCACSSRSSSSSSSRSDADTVVAELALPAVPASLKEPAQRAKYVLDHFWDAMDFRDTLRSHNRAFMEQSLVNFISLFPHADEAALPFAIDGLWQKAVVDSEACALLGELAEQYLADRESPMRSEAHYVLFLESYLRLPGLSEVSRVRPAFQLEEALKNRPGTVAADFAYVDRAGQRQTLHGQSASRLLLVFYNPDCDHCVETLQWLQENEPIQSLLKKRELAILALYTEDNQALWDETKSSLPQNWLVGMDADNIVGQGLYAFPAMPVMYLLGADKTVLLKDPTQEQLDAFLSN